MGRERELRLLETEPGINIIPPEATSVFEVDWLEVR